jgi:hypothetical protein
MTRLGRLMGARGRSAPPLGQTGSLAMRLNCARAAHAAQYASPMPTDASNEMAKPSSRWMVSESA